MKNSQSVSILFICHGNICRSPMAEFIMNFLINKANMSDKIKAHSAATSTEEIGCDIHHGTRQQLRIHNIPYKPRQARQVTLSDYNNFDYLIVMDDNNLLNLKRIIPYDKENKIFKLLSFTGSNKNIADPWYTNDFETTYRQITLGCEALLHFLTESVIQHT